MSRPDRRSRSDAYPSAPWRGLWAAGVLALLLAPLVTEAFETRRVATGLSRPVFLTAPPGDNQRLFVVEQHTGAIKVLNRGDWTLEETPFLVVSGLSTGNEQGLLGLAFDPDYATNGYFYVDYTDTAPATRIVRYQVSAGDPDVADPNSASPVLSFPQPETNHNGGWLGFGDDGYLYVSTGDGGGGNDLHGPPGNAQSLDTFLGKILRLDVGGDDFPADATRNYAIPPDNPFVATAGLDEIWAYGLRNPWRCSFDWATGDLYIADVGQNRCEEVNVQPAASSGGENYGWRLREGVIATPTGGVGGDPPDGAIDPVFDYPHPGTAVGEPCSGPGAGFTGNSVTGGVVYRGPIAELQGRYLFADFFGDSLWSFVFDGSAPASFDGHNYTGLTDHVGEPGFTPDAGSIGSISALGEDPEGNLYVLDLSDGEVFRVPEPAFFGLQVTALLCLVGLARCPRSARSTRTRC